MCKLLSNSNNGEKYEKEFKLEWYYWKREVNLLWLGGFMCFVVHLQLHLCSLSFLYCLCTLQPLCPLRLLAQNGLCVPWGGYRERFLSYSLYFFSFSSAPLEAQQLSLFCSPWGSTIGNAACAQSKPCCVLKPPQNAPLALWLEDIRKYLGLILNAKITKYCIFMFIYVFVIMDEQK